MKTLKRWLKWGWLVIWVVMPLVAPPSMRAQGGSPPDPPEAGPDIKFEHLTIDDGLPNNFTSFVLQDDQGFIWVGTKEGLSKYDGSEFTVYTHDPADPNSLSRNFVQWICQDSRGTLWVSSWGGGLNQYDPVNDNFIHYRHNERNPDSLAHDDTWAMFEDSQGRYWVSTIGGGLDQFDPGTETFTHHRHNPSDPHSLSHNDVSVVDEDAAGMLWVGTYGGGLNRFDPAGNTFAPYRHNPNNANSLINDFIWVVHVDPAGAIWLATEGGLDKFDPRTETFVHYQYDETDPYSLSHNTVTAIHQDSRGDLWFGTYGGGVNQYDALHDRFIRYQFEAGNPASLSDNNLFFINEDDAGTLWFVTSNGLDKFDPGSDRFHHYAHHPNQPNSLSGNQVSAFYQDSPGVLWIGAKDGGLNKLDRATNRFTHYQVEQNNPNSLSHNAVVSIRPGSEGVLWLGTLGGGLNKFDPAHETFTPYLHRPNDANSLYNNNIWAIDLDAAGNLWIAMDGGGVDRFDPSTETFTHFGSDNDNPNSLVSDWVVDIDVDSTGVVWVASAAGVSAYNPVTATFTNYRVAENDPAGLSTNNISTIYEDSHGVIWVGTTDGLNRFDRSTQSFAVYRQEDGLASNAVAGIVADNQGNLWISTSQGISKFNPVEATFRNYDQRDGLQSNLFLWGSAYKSEAGELFFGGVNGFNAFFPTALADNPQAPPVVLTDFQLFNEPVPIGGASPLQQHINLADEIILNYDQSIFSFKFSALNYRAPDKNQYAYKLEGFDKEWVHRDSRRRFATYTNLDPGQYTFHVKAANNDGVWNETGVAIRIIIEPPWWQTVWFRGAVMLLGVGLVYGGFRWRTSAIGVVFPLKDNPFSVKIIETHRPDSLTVEQISPVTQQPNKTLDERQVQCIMVLPLLSRNQVIGTIGVDTSQPGRTFTPAEISLAETVANQIAGAIENAQLYNEEQRQRRMAESLREVAVAMNSSLDRNTVLVKIVEQLSRVVECDRTAIFLQDGDHLVLVVGDDLPETLMNFRIPLSGKNPAIRTFQSRQSVIVPNVQNDPGWEIWFEASHQIKSWLGVPLIIGSACIGVLSLGNFKLNAFGEADVQILALFANQAAIAIENTYLFEQEHAALEQAEKLYAASLALSATMDLNQVLDLILTELRHVVPYDSASVQELRGNYTEVVKGVGFPEPSKIIGLRFGLKTSELNERIMQTQQPVILADASQHPEFQVDPHTELGIRAWMGIPLLFGDQFIGQITLDKKEAGFYTQDHARLATAFAAQAAIAVQNARLFNQAQQAKETAVQAQEAAIVALNQAEAANQAKSVFLTHMSHELRTPLNAILGYTQIFKRDGHLMASYGRPIDTIHRSGEHLLTMINDILDLSKIEAGKVALEPSDFHLSRFLKTLVEMSQIRAEQKGICLIYDAAPDLPTGVRGDEIRLREVLLNLLGNAIKFTEQGGVTFRVKRPDSRLAPQRLRFEVEDTGIGIPSEQRAEIFLPFHQVGEPRFQAQGTGLGLAISQRLVNLMGGELHVESPPASLASGDEIVGGPGSLFWFELNLPEAAHRIEPVESNHRPIVGYQGQRLKTLIADDNPENRELLAAILRPLGFEIVEAVNGVEALDRAATLQPDLVLLDLVMPELGGLEK